MEEALELAAEDINEDEDQTRPDDVQNILPNKTGEIEIPEVPEVTPRRSARLERIRNLDYNLLNKSGERTYKETGIERGGRR